MLERIFNDKQKSMLALLFVTISIYTGILVYLQTVIGVSYWDIFVYLDNAMLFSHINIGSQLSVPPVLSLLTSIPFQLGFIGESSLFVVSGILFVFVILAFYLILCERFNPVESFMGALIFSMFSLVVTWAVSGSNDLPALCFSLWAFYMTFKGVNNGFKYYYPAFAFFVLAFFTRFTQGFVLIVMLCYMLINYNRVRLQLTRGNLLKFGVYVLAFVVVITGVYLSYQHTIPFISQFIEVSSSSHVSSVNVGYELNPFYYFQNLPEFISSWSASDSYFTTLSTSYNHPTFLSYAVIVLASIGLLSFAYKLKAYLLVDSVRDKFKFLLVVLLSLFTIISYTHVSYMVTELAFTLVVLLLHSCLKENTLDLDLMMILWMGIFVILHSYHPVKVDRYIIPALIPLTYYMINTTKTISKKIKHEKTATIILVIILVLFIPVNASYLNSIAQPNPHSLEERHSYQWLENYDQNYRDYNISSDRGVAYSWYLKKYVYTSIPRVLKTTNQTLEDKLKEVNAKYYIDSTSYTDKIDGYHEIYNNNNTKYRVKIYEKNGEN